MPKTNHDTSDYVLIAPKTSLNDSSNSSFLNIRHPRTGELALFLYNSENRKLFELNKHTDSYSSWFVNENVYSDGSMFIASPFDPLFFLVALLKVAGESKYVVLDQILSNEERKLDCFKDVSQIKLIADHKEAGGFVAYRYNEKKTIDWLKAKVHRTAAAVSKSSIFVCDENESENLLEDEENRRYACGLVSEYLDTSLKAKLMETLNIVERKEKRKSSGPEPNSKKIKTEATEDYSKLAIKNSASEKKKNLTRSQKALDKVDKKGMKNIASFFTPKK